MLVEFKTLSEECWDIHLMMWKIFWRFLKIFGRMLIAINIKQVDNSSRRPCLVPRVGMIMVKIQRIGWIRTRMMHVRKAVVRAKTEAKNDSYCRE